MAQKGFVMNEGNQYQGFFNGNYYLINGEMVAKFGIMRAFFLAYMQEKAKYANKNEQGEFELYYDKIEQDLNLNRKTIAKYVKYFKELGIISARRDIDFTQRKGVMLYKVN